LDFDASLTSECGRHNLRILGNLTKGFVGMNETLVQQVLQKIEVVCEVGEGLCVHGANSSTQNNKSKLSLQKFSADQLGNKGGLR
jgi:hypothetical protein